LTWFCRPGGKSGRAKNAQKTLTLKILAHFCIGRTSVPSLNYRNIGVGRAVGEAKNDEGCMNTMAALSKNMAWHFESCVLDCLTWHNEQRVRGSRVLNVYAVQYE